MLLEEDINSLFPEEKISFEILDKDYLVKLTEDAYHISGTNNAFLVFKSIDNLFLLIYSTETSIICYDLIALSKINEIKMDKEQVIKYFSHYLDNKNKRDLILTVPSWNNNIKIFNARTWECIITLDNKNGNIISAFFLNDIKKEENYIITFFYNIYNTKEKNKEIRVYNYDQKLIKKLKLKNDSIFLMDIYYDIKYQKNYLILGCKNYIKSLDYDKKLVYNQYKDNNPVHYSIKILEGKDGNVKLIESFMDGFIKIWNFHTGKMLKNIRVGRERE